MTEVDALHRDPGPGHHVRGPAPEGIAAVLYSRLARAQYAVRWFSIEGMPKGAMTKTSGRSLFLAWLGCISAITSIYLVVHRAFEHDWRFDQWAQIVFTAWWVMLAVLHIRSYRIVRRHEAEQLVDLG